jgi:hypothetical protein
MYFFYLAMSLTSFLELTDVKARFRQEFSKPIMPKPKELLAPPLTKNYRLVGTAFDYLLRFYIEQQNLQAISHAWAAEASVKILKRKGLIRLYEQAYLILVQAKEEYARYLETHQVTDDLLKSSLLLAKLDVVYRAGKIPENLEQIDEKDIEDLRNLLAIVEPSTFKSSGVVILNPEFGLASALVRGADADLLIDDLLIDIKTVKEASLSQEYFNQLIGYYALSKIERIDGTPPQHAIKRLGIYFSRYAHLYIMPIEEVIDAQRFPDFLKWFRNRARVRA